MSELRQSFGFTGQPTGYLPVSPTSSFNTKTRSRRIFSSPKWVRFDGKNWQEIEIILSLLPSRTWRIAYDRKWIELTPSPETVLSLSRSIRGAETLGRHFGWELYLTDSPNYTQWTVRYSSGVKRIADGQYLLGTFDGVDIGLSLNDWIENFDTTIDQDAVNLDMRAAKARAVAEGLDTINLDPTIITATADASGYGCYNAGSTGWTFAQCRDAITANLSYRWIQFARVWDRTTYWAFGRGFLRFDRTQVANAKSCILRVTSNGETFGTPAQLLRACRCSPYLPAWTEPDSRGAWDDNYGYVRQGGYGGATLGYDNTGVTTFSLVDGFVYQSDITAFYNDETDDWLTIGTAIKNDVENDDALVPGAHLQVNLYEPGTADEPFIEVTEAPALKRNRIRDNLSLWT